MPIELKILRSIIDNISCLKDRTKEDYLGSVWTNICLHHNDTVFTIDDDKLEIVYNNAIVRLTYCIESDDTFNHSFSLSNPNLIEDINKMMRKWLIYHKRHCTCMNNTGI